MLGLQDTLGDRFSKVVQATYEVTDPTIDLQLVSLKEAGVDLLISACTPKFSAMVFRKKYDLNWKADAHREQRRRLGRRRHGAGRTRSRDRRDQFVLSEGPDRSVLEGRSPK